MSGYAAAAAFCVVSVGANLQYGLSLGKTPIDKATYAAASVAADVFKMAVPMLALSVWSAKSSSGGPLATTLSIRRTAPSVSVSRAAM